MENAAELIDGNMYMMAPPSRRHQAIAGEIFTSIHNYLKQKNGSCIPYIAPFAVFLNNDNTNYVEPDISVICDPNKLSDRGCEGAPDWIIEIVSPSSLKHGLLHQTFQISDSRYPGILGR